MLSTHSQIMLVKQGFGSLSLVDLLRLVLGTGKVLLDFQLVFDEHLGDTKVFSFLHVFDRLQISVVEVAPECS